MSFITCKKSPDLYNRHILTGKMFHGNASYEFQIGTLQKGSGTPITAAIIANTTVGRHSM
jgi:hypothetical protein